MGKTTQVREESSHTLTLYAARITGSIFEAMRVPRSLFHEGRTNYTGTTESAEMARRRLAIKMELPL